MMGTSMVNPLVANSAACVARWSWIRDALERLNLRRLRHPVSLIELLLCGVLVCSRHAGRTLAGRLVPAIGRSANIPLKKRKGNLSLRRDLLTLTLGQ